MAKLGKKRLKHLQNFKLIFDYIVLTASLLSFLNNDDFKSILFHKSNQINLHRQGCHLNSEMSLLFRSIIFSAFVFFHFLFISHSYAN